MKKGKQGKDGGKHKAAAGLHQKGKASTSGSATVIKKATVNISLDVEQQVKDLLQDLSSQPGAAETSQTAAVTDNKRIVKQYSAVFDGLIHHGFSKEQVELVLRSLPSHDVRLDDALEWLCFHLPPVQLPKKFTGAARTAARYAEVRVVSSAETKPTAAYDPAPELQSASEENDKESEAEAEDEDEQAQGESARKAAEDDADAAKAWIRQQYMAGGDEDDGSDQDEMSSAGSIDDWELWADPREVARRKQERARAKLPAEVRCKQVALELHQAKEQAAAAKSAGDKARQKAAGEIIRALKAEMEQLGMTEDAAMALVASTTGNEQQQHSQADAAQSTQVASPPAAMIAAGSGGQADFDMEAVNLFADNGEQTTGDLADATQSAAQHSAGSPHAANAIPDAARSQAAALTADGVKTSEDVVDDWMTQFDLFGGEGATADGGAGETSAASSTPGPGAASTTPGTVAADTHASSSSTGPRASSSAAPEPLTPWGMHVVQGHAGKRHDMKLASVAGPRKAKDTQAVAKDVLQPRALLSQQCQKQGWQQPRYEKLPALAGSTAGVRYSVTISMGVPRGAAKKKGWGGVRTFQLGLDEDGWPTVQDAQNAASTRALYELFGADQPLHHSLGPPFSELWLRWESSGEAVRQQDMEAAQAYKAEFVSQLLADKQAAQAQNDKDADAVERQGRSQELSAARQRAASLEDDVAAEEWEAMADGGAVQQEMQAPVTEEDSKPAPLSAGEQQVSAGLLAAMQRWWASPEGSAMLESRGRLPILAIKQQLYEALDSQDIVLVCGDTGCGKTTQVPQYLLEQQTLAGTGARACVICTQPRRIAAISVADRVAAERGEPAAGTPNPASTVGYHVRLDAAVTQHTRLTFCTTGILLRRLTGDPKLSHVSHVIIDEVHERSMQGDFLLALVKDLVQARRAAGNPLKVLLMSATLDAATFAAYMGDCPVLTAQGRTFPVETLYLEDVYNTVQYKLARDAAAAHRSSSARVAAAEMRKHAAGGSRGKQALLSGGWGDEEKDTGPLNPLYDAELYEEYDLFVRRNLARVNEEVIDYDLLEEVIAHIHDTQPPGAILVFLPGMGEISNLQQRLLATRRFAHQGSGKSGTAWLRVLHSGVSPEEQRTAFITPPPGVRKVVLATNIAETSLTIEDVVYVVDSGRHKERRYDPSRRMSLLVLEWVARASAVQRWGRAGRVRPGKAYCLYTRHRFEQLLHAYGAPEIVRVPLAELVLQIHALSLGPAATFLGRVLQPPSAKSVMEALITLSQVGALLLTDGREQLTPLGQHLAQLPVDPRLGKLLVLGAVFGCLAPAATIAAALSHKSPFAAPSQIDKRDEAESVRKAMADQGIAAGQQSDHLLLVSAFNTWHSMLAGTPAKPSSNSKAVGKGHGGKAGGDDPRKAASQWARKHFMNEQVLHELKDMRVQLAQLLGDAGLLPQQHADNHWLDDANKPWNKYAHLACMVKAVLCAALTPNVSVMSDASSPHSAPTWLSSVGIHAGTTSSAPASSGQQPQLANTQVEQVLLHPSCVAHGMTTPQFKQPFVVYLEKVKTARAFLRDVTPVSPLSLLLFGGPLTVLHADGVVLVDGWVRVRAAAQTAVVVKGLRSALDNLLQQKVRNPAMQLEGPHAQVIPTIVQMLQDEDRQKF